LSENGHALSPKPCHNFLELRSNGLVSDYRLQSAATSCFKKASDAAPLPLPDSTGHCCREGLIWRLGADLIFASKGKAALLSCDERQTRFFLLSKVEDKAAASFHCALIARLLDIPFVLRRTLTFGEGLETARFKELEAATGMSTCFCAPRSPWQSGANENTNGLIRQYIPRGISFCKVTENTLHKGH
jgi:hypothetical protein